jgi:putative SOS response-associated peptidase YedK
MPIVGVNREGSISIRELRWGLVPYWAKDVKIGYKAINARAETVEEKPMFREAFKRRRCLVPASGYFEWKPEGSAKQPYFIHDPDGELLMFAGLWESWRESKEAEPLYTFTIVTGPPGLASGDIHDRAPVILEEGAWAPWLTGEIADAVHEIKDTREPKLIYHPVPKAVGSPRNDSPRSSNPSEFECKRRMTFYKSPFEQLDARGGPSYGRTTQASRRASPWAHAQLCG